MAVPGWAQQSRICTWRGVVNGRRYNGAERRLKRRWADPEWGKRGRVSGIKNVGDLVVPDPRISPPLFKASRLARKLHDRLRRTVKHTQADHLRARNALCPAPAA